MKALILTNPSVRILQVMEYLMASGSKPVKQIDIARDLQLAPATVNRIIKTLSDRGYLLLTSEKYCVRNFRLIRNVPMSENYLSVLNQLMNDISSKHGVSVEAIVASGFDLLWHSRTQLPDATVAIRANTGFRRNLYELDALARLYLSRVGWDEISYKFFQGGFFKTGVEMKSVSPREAKRIIEDAADSDFDCDMDGNHVGVRRFATIVEDDKGNFLHLLSMAEAATPVFDSTIKMAECQKILKQAKETLQAQIRSEASANGGEGKHELGPAHVG